MNRFGHPLNRKFAVRERLQFVTSPAIARRVRERSKELKLSRGDLIEIAVKEYFARVDAQVEMEKRNELFSKFESEK
jgi:hypothetical protein